MTEQEWVFQLTLTPADRLRMIYNYPPIDDEWRTTHSGNELENKMRVYEEYTLTPK